jgi:hypothetical protein
MFRCQKTKFWLENPINLLCSCDIVPLDDMILSEQMNAITRLIFVVFLILILFNFHSSFLFLLLSLVLIIILYYIQRTQMNQSKKENFECNTRSMPCNNTFLNTPQVSPQVANYAQNVYSPRPGLAQSLIGTPSSCYNCNIETSLDSPIQNYNPNACDGKIDTTGVYNNPNYVSNNQKLAGFANPKTLIQPVMVEKSHDLDSWRTNNMVVHSAVNEISQIEQYQNGYQVTTCCPPKIDGVAVPTTNPYYKTVPLTILEQQQNNDTQGSLTPDYNTIPVPPPAPPTTDISTVLPTPPPPPPPPPNVEGAETNTEPTANPDSNENYRKPVVEKYTGPINTTEVPEIPPKGTGPFYQGEAASNTSQSEQNYDYPFLITTSLPLTSDVILPDEYGGAIDTTSGYNATQLLRAGLPSNLPAGVANQDPRMRPYNKNMFKQTLQPGVYSSNQIIEPINNNIGISFTQQFEPLLDRMDPVTGKLSFTNLDPRIVNPDLYKEKLPEMDMTATESNVYDPRFTGYGTSYRAYTDEHLGQTKFFYDDVDAIRMPNYIVRSGIDTHPFADRYGPIPKGDELGNKSTAEIRALANDAFLQSSLEHRNDLMEKQSRKANARAWQQRAMPINTNGQRGLGSMSLGIFG